MNCDTNMENFNCQIHANNILRNLKITSIYTWMDVDIYIQREIQYVIFLKWCLTLSHSLLCIMCMAFRKGEDIQVLEVCMFTVNFMLVTKYEIAKYRITLNRRTLCEGEN